MTEPLRASLHALNNAAHAAARVASAAGRQDLHGLLCRIATEVDSAVDAEAPAAAPSRILADRPRVDITDLWHEAGGDENEVCEAYFDARTVTVRPKKSRTTASSPHTPPPLTDAGNRGPGTLLLPPGPRRSGAQPKSLNTCAPSVRPSARKSRSLGPPCSRWASS